MIVGAGAFATENARTAIERGADWVSLIQWRRGSVSPLILDYLNFARPYDHEFAHEKTGS